MVYTGRPSAGCEQCRYVSPGIYQHHIVLTRDQAGEETMRSSPADMWQMCTYWQSLWRLQERQRLDLQRRGTKLEQTRELDSHVTLSGTGPAKSVEGRCRDRFLLRSVRHGRPLGFHQGGPSRHVPQSTSSSMRVRDHGKSHRRSRNSQTGTEQICLLALGNSGRYTGCCASAAKRSAHRGVAPELVRSKRVNGASVAALVLTRQ